MVENTIQVGKFTLESLTTGMYSDPKIIYREYIQNSVDSLENAVSQNIIEKQSMRIDVIVDSENSLISIKDNGTGISSDAAVSTLLNIGSSQKRHTNNRGFRGIGRLGGMSYCDTLIFTTSYENEQVKTIVEFDCKKLRKLLIPGESDNLDLMSVIQEVTTVHTEEEKMEKHYFCVELRDVIGFSDLLNIESVKSYISQVSPLPYKSKYFVYSTELHKFLLENDYEVEEFPIFVGEDSDDLSPVYKPNRHRFHTKNSEDSLSGINPFRVEVDGELFALGWYGECGLLGTVSEPELSGIRARKGNILIGDNKTLNTIFRESRFNGWLQGELFILTDKLIPNARRDDFEQNDAYYQFVQTLSDGIGLEISKTIREASSSRNDKSSKLLKEVQKTIDSALSNVNEGFNSSKDKDKIIKDLSEAEESLNKTKVREDLTETKDNLQKKLAETLENVSTSNNFKINQINSGIDKKSKKILAVVSDILSDKLAKTLVDDIIEEIINTLNRK